MGGSLGTLQINTFGPMTIRHKPGIYFTYHMVLVTIDGTLCMPFTEFLGEVVKNSQEKTCKKKHEF